MMRTGACLTVMSLPLMPAAPKVHRAGVYLGHSNLGTALPLMQGGATILPRNPRKSRRQKRSNLARRTSFDSLFRGRDRFLRSRRECDAAESRTRFHRLENSEGVAGRRP